MLRLAPRALCMQESTLLVSHMCPLELIREVFPSFQIKALNTGERWWMGRGEELVNEQNKQKITTLWAVNTSSLRNYKRILWEEH